MDTSKNRFNVSCFWALVKRGFRFLRAFKITSRKDRQAPSCRIFPQRFNIVDLGPRKRVSHLSFCQFLKVFDSSRIFATTFLMRFLHERRGWIFCYETLSLQLQQTRK